MPEARKRTVLDTGVVLQATLSDAGPAFQVLRLLDAGRIAVLVSPRVRSEYEDVLTRASIRRRNPFLTDARARAVLARIDAMATMVAPPRHYIEYPRDPDDEPLLDLAIEVRAEYLISRDNDLLALDDDPGFRRRYPFLSILDPVHFLRALAEDAATPGGHPIPS